MKCIALTAALLLVTACGGKTSPSTTATQAQTAAGAETPPGECSCPMGVEGSKISYEDTPDGAAIVFTTDSGDPADVQARVAKKAEHHNSPEPKRAEAHIPHTARAENTAQGARLVMVPANPADLEALRTHVREHVAEMQAGKCPMMQGGSCPMHGHGHGDGEHQHGHPHEHGGHEHPPH